MTPNNLLLARVPSPGEKAHPGDTPGGHTSAGRVPEGRKSAVLPKRIGAKAAVVLTAPRDLGTLPAHLPL